ncbi:MAG TPA: hypothetical protein VK436_08345, partial [Methanocella sp.]|nr:hypothetical protein [Methanocella sp.]
MKSSGTSVEEVVRKIQSAMRTKSGNMPIQSDAAKASDKHIDLSEDTLRDLDFELNDVNLRWNIITDLPITSHRKIIGP